MPRVPTLCCVAERWIVIRCAAFRNAIESKNKSETFYPLTRVQRGHNESDFESTTSSIPLFSLPRFSLASVFAGIGIHATHQRIFLSFFFCLPSALWCQPNSNHNCHSPKCESLRHVNHSCFEFYQFMISCSLHWCPLKKNELKLIPRI